MSASMSTDWDKNMLRKQSMDMWDMDLTPEIFDSIDMQEVSSSNPFEYNTTSLLTKRHIEEVDSVASNSTPNIDDSEENSQNQRQSPQPIIVYKKSPNNYAYPATQTHKRKLQSVKKTKQFEIVVKIPQMPLHDIRRTYLATWNKVFNTLDYKLLTKFMEKYCRGDVTLTKRFPKGGSENLSLVEVQDMKGRNALLCYWAAIMHLTPDQVVRLDHVKIEPRKDGEGTKITSRLLVRGYRPFDITVDKLMENIQHTIDHSTRHNTDRSDDNSVKDSPIHIPSDTLLTEEQIKAIEQTDEIFKHHLPALYPEPRPMNCLGSFTFYLDNDKFIERMECLVTPDLSESKCFFSDK